jgi:hypothetical protein
VNTEDLESFLGAAIEAVEGIEDGIVTVFMVNDTDDSLLCMAVEESAGLNAAVTAQMDQMMAKRPYFAAMATKVGWSPSNDEPTTGAWLVVGVDPERTAEFCVKRIVEDEKWWRLSSDDVPWFAISTAGSLRDAMLHGTPLRPKNATDKPDLWKRPDELRHPAVDPDGML